MALRSTAAVFIFLKAFMHSMLSSFSVTLAARQRNTSWPMVTLTNQTPEALVRHVEKIRRLMLVELGLYGEKKFPAFARRVRNASDILGLWYARSDLMSILATTHGESVAREKVADISGKFKGLLPKSLSSRIGLRNRY